MSHTLKQETEPLEDIYTPAGRGSYDGFADHKINPHHFVRTNTPAGLYHAGMDEMTIFEIQEYVNAYALESTRREKIFPLRPQDLHRPVRRWRGRGRTAF